MEEVLKPLRDIEGVTGSFACTHAGNVLVSDLPRLSVEQMRAASGNLVNLFASARDGISDCQRLTCRYDALTLEVLAHESGFLCAMVQAPCDNRMLQTVMRMLARRVFGTPRH